MAKKLKTKIPVFNKGLLDLADACARDLWSGTSYQTGGKIFSDESLLKLFAQPYCQAFFDANTSSISQFGEKEIAILIDVCDIKKSNIRISNQDLKGGLSHLYGKILADVKDEVYSAKISHPDYESLLVKSLGRAFFKSNSKAKGGAFITLASRLLFFVTPNLTIYNYSGSLADSIGLAGGQPQLTLPLYNIALHDGLRENWFNLSSYKMPLPSDGLDDDTWLLAKRSGWWQRRIYDLALLINFKQVEPRPFIIEALKYDALLDP